MPHESVPPGEVKTRQSMLVTGRTEEGRKPVLFGNREKHTEVLLNRKRGREKRGKLIERQLKYWYIYNVDCIMCIWVDPNFQVKEQKETIW